MKVRKTIALLFFIAYPGFLIWMGYRPFQRNIIDPGYAYYELKTTTEDRPEFADPNLEAADWSTAQRGHKGLWWLRAKVDLSSPRGMSEKMGISIMLKGSYELYFDGALIGKNGMIDASGIESRAGLYRKTFMVPDSLAGEGSHQVALRIANHQASSAQLPYIRTGDYLLLAGQPLSLALFLHIVAGIFLVVAFYFSGMYFIYYRQADLLVFALLSFSFFGLTILEYVKYYIDYVHTWQYFRLLVIQILSFGVSFMLPLFYYLYFYKKISWRLMGLLVVVLTGMILFNPGFDRSAYYMMLAGFVFTLGIVLRALEKEEKNAWPAVWSTLFFSSCFILYYDFTLFTGFVGIVGFALFALNRQIKDQKRLYEDSLIRAGRLEVELLKKKIQPHFLMNTLTSLINMVEDEPKTGVKMIHALARLFNMLNEISDQALIPVHKEIELCRIHLQMMEYQREVHYPLQVSAIPKSEHLPPTVLLTIIENGITHQKPIDGQLRFCIHFKEDEGEKTYEIQSKGKLRMSKRKKENGIGYQYIQARLEEWKKGQWVLENEAGEETYTTRIKIKKENEYIDR